MGGQNSTTICKGSKRHKKQKKKLYQKGPGNSDDALPKIIDKEVKALNGIIHIVNNDLLSSSSFKILINKNETNKMNLFSISHVLMNESYFFCILNQNFFKKKKKKKKKK